MTGELIRLARNAWCFTVLALRGTVLQGHSGKMSAYACNTRKIFTRAKEWERLFLL